MNLRDQLLEASKRAGEVLETTAAKHRIFDEGYTRIDPIAIAEVDGVPVMARPLDKLLGAFLRADGSPGILVNSQRPVGMVHMTCAHELGHYFLGHSTMTDEDLDYGNRSSPDEQAANEFAFRLLMPRWLVVHILKQKGWGLVDLERPDVVYQLSLRLGVSFTAMTWTLSRIKFLSVSVASKLSQISPSSLKKAASPVGVQAPRDSDVWVLDMRDKDLVIEPRINDLFVARLPNHLGAGYIWTADEAENAGFTIRPVVLDSNDGDKQIESVIVGGGESVQYLLEPNAGDFSSEDVHPVLLSERQPWDSGAIGDHLSLRTHYESISDGLSRGSRMRLIKDAAQA